MKASRINKFVVASIGLTLVTLVLTYFDIQENKKANGWINHTYRVINESSKLMSVVKDAESSMRGYVITGDTIYLRPYQLAKKKEREHFDSLKKLTRSNPQQQELLNFQINHLLEIRIKLLDHRISTFNRGGQDSAFALIKTNEGKKVMDSLRFYMNLLENRENVQLAERNRYLVKFYSIVDTTRYLILVVIAMISGFALISLFKKERINHELVDQLKQSNKELEERVLQRTAELEDKNKAAEQMNTELHNSVEEIKSFYDTLQIQNIKTEHALKEVSDLYNYSPCGYHSLSEEGNIIRINETELGWLGYKREELIGKKFTDILSDSSKAVWLTIFKEYRAKGSAYNLEFDLIKKDGSIIPILLNSSALYDVNGNFVMSRSTLFDLTKRKKMEQQLRELNQNLVKVNEEKNNFLGIASHDLKSPLNSMLGVANLMKLESANFTKNQHQYLAMIFDSIEKMKGLIGDLLDVNRIEQGKALTQIKEEELVQVISKVIHSFKVQAANKSIQLIFDDHPPTLFAFTDSTVLTQILENLISNALKFSLQNKKVSIHLHSTIDRAIIDVRDEGPGIKPEEFSKLFGKFQKLSAKPTAGENSTGLGLSIVKELVQALDGKISCQSRVGVGTTFTVNLPLHQK